MLTFHGHTQAVYTCSYTEKFNIYSASEQDEPFVCNILACNFLDMSYTTMGGEEESLQLRIDVSLDQDKDENWKIIYSQRAENSDVDVVTLESDCPPLSSSSSSSSSSDGTMSGPEHVEIISTHIPPKVFKFASKRFTNLSFAER